MYTGSWLINRVNEYEAERSGFAGTLRYFSPTTSNIDRAGGTATVKA